MRGCTNIHRGGDRRSYRRSPGARGAERGASGRARGAKRGASGWGQGGAKRGLAGGFDARCGGTGGEADTRGRAKSFACCG